LRSAFAMAAIALAEIALAATTATATQQNAQPADPAAQPPPTGSEAAPATPPPQQTPGASPQQMPSAPTQPAPATETPASGAQSPAPAPARAPTAADITAARSARLDGAKRLLDEAGANGQKLKGDSASRLTTLRRDFADLVMAYWASRTEAKANANDRSDWRDKFSDIERALSYLIGGGASTRPSALGTSGTAGNDRETDSNVTAVSELGAETVMTLDAFRRELELFYVETLDDTVVAPAPSSSGVPASY